LLDTSVIIDLGRLSAVDLPDEFCISTISLAELSAGINAALDPEARSKRLDLLQRAETSMNPIPFDETCARAYGRIYAAVEARGRKARGARSLDLLIAATALSNELPIYTRNPADLTGLEELLHVVAVS
jgi:predicted nucleic acid-binding protein